MTYNYILFYAAAFKTDTRKGFKIFKELILELKSNKALKDFKVITAGDVDTEISDRLSELVTPNHYN